MRKNTGRHGKRREGQTTLSISLPEWLKKELAELAQADDRTTSNYLVQRLTELVRRSKAAKEGLAAT
jgi:predicted transcriptional regulator